MVGLRLARGLTLAQFQHLLDEFHPAVVAGHVGGVGTGNDTLKSYQMVLTKDEA